MAVKLNAQFRRDEDDKSVRQTQVYEIESRK